MNAAEIKALSKAEVLEYLANPETDEETGAKLFAHLGKLNAAEKEKGMERAARVVEVMTVIEDFEITYDEIKKAFPVSQRPHLATKKAANATNRGAILISVQAGKGKPANICKDDPLPQYVPKKLRGLFEENKTKAKLEEVLKNFIKDEGDKFFKTTEGQTYWDTWVKFIMEGPMSPVKEEA